MAARGSFSVSRAIGNSCGRNVSPVGPTKLVQDRHDDQGGMNHRAAAAKDSRRISLVRNQWKRLTHARSSQIRNEISVEVNNNDQYIIIENQAQHLR